MQTVPLLAITAYQRWISPYKGYACAYRVGTGRSSCSTLGLRAIRRHGLFRGLGILRLRLDRCAATATRLVEARGSGHRQRGFCDVGCPCDVPGCDPTPSNCSHDATDFASVCDCLGCDCGSGRKNRHPTRLRKSR